MSDEYREMLRRVEDDVEDQLGSMDDSDLGMAFRDGDIDFHEIADSAVPIHYGSIFEALLEAGLSSAEPEIDGATNPAQMAQYVLYDEAEREAHEAFERFKENEEDQERRFREFLSEHETEARQWDAEEAYWQWDDDPRRNVSEWHDDSEWYEDIFADWRSANGF